MSSLRLRQLIPLMVAAVLAFAGGTALLRACPFCSAIALTFSEEIAGSDVAVIARLVEAPPEAKAAGGSGAGTFNSKAKFEIVDVLKGEKALAKTRKFETLYFGNSPVGTLFLVMGVEPPAINWATPIAMSERGRGYLVKSLALPKEGPERLAFFQQYLEDSDELLGRDAYDEFAKTPYAGLKEVKNLMEHDKILGWVQDIKIPPSRRNLYWMMLGICGRPDDIPLFEEKIRSADKQMKSNALIAAYLALKGADGMPLIEDLFLKNPNADYIDTYAAVMALRFHGQDEKIIPRPRLLEGLHYMLDRPKLADLVIPDLGRWQDWSVMDRLVQLFKNADEESIWVRVPVISYLQACPLPKAKQYIAELAQIDPDAVKRANSFFPLNAASAPSASAADAKPDAAAADAADSAQPAGTAPAEGSASAKPATATSDAAAGGKKVSGPAPAAPPAGPTAPPPGKKTTQVQKPVGDAQVSSDKKNRGAAARSRGSSAQTAGRLGARLSRSSAPQLAPQVGLWSVLGYLTLAGGVLAIFLQAILRGGQQASA